MTQKQIMQSFAELYWSTLPLYKQYSSISTNTQTSKRYQTELKNSLKWLLKHCGTLVPPKASIAALNIAIPHGIDLFALQWKDQKTAEKVIGGKKARELFIHEHEKPVSEMYEKILKASNRETIFDILMNQSIVWITREEEERLHQYIREKDAYLNAGIKVVPNPNGDEWLEKSWNNGKQSIKLELILSDFEGKFGDPNRCAFATALKRGNYQCLAVGTLSATVKKDSNKKELSVMGVFIDGKLISSPMYGFGANEYDKVKEALSKNPSTTAYLQLREE